MVVASISVVADVVVSSDCVVVLINALVVVSVMNVPESDPPGCVSVDS